MDFVKVAIGFVVLIITIVGVSFLVGYFTPSSTDSSLVEYNGYNFVKLDNGIWSVALSDYVDSNSNPFVLNVHNTPYDLDKVGAGPNLENFFPSNKTYLSYDPALWDNDPSLKVALMDLSLKLAGTSVFFQNTLFNPIIVCSQDVDEVCKEIGVHNCEQNPDEKIISFVKGDTNSIYLNGNCLVVESSKGNFVKATDRLIFSWFNIMEP